MAIKELEEWLRTNHVEFVDVAKARRIMWNGERLPTVGPRPFHFVMYGRSNWLVMVGPSNRHNIAAMTEWATLFGDRLAPVLARWTSDGPVFHGVDNTRPVWPPSAATASASARQSIGGPQLGRIRLRSER